MSNVIENLKLLTQQIEEDYQKFKEKGNQTAGKRVRVKSLETIKVLKQLRIEIQENALKEAK